MSILNPLNLSDTMLGKLTQLSARLEQCIRKCCQFINSLSFQWSQPRHLLLSSPVQSPSPPTNTMKAMRLFDGLGSPNSACAISSLISSPRSTPRVMPLKSRLLFTENGEPRRSSFPSHGSHRRNLNDCDSTASVEKVKLANVNPFTPTAMMASFNKKRRNSSVNT